MAGWDVFRKVGFTKSHRMRKLFIGAGFAGLLMTAGTPVFAENGAKNETVVQAASSNNTTGFSDFDASAYWANDMLWAINKGLIQGYKNVAHPTNKALGKGNWLNPYGALTEGQGLMIVLRYTHNDELAKTKSTNSKWSAAVAYQLAEKYNLPTIASLHYTTPANAVMTRGGLAQILASAHFGHRVSYNDSVKFMFEAGITHGKSAGDGSTLENFGVDDPLQRAHIVSFMKRYHDFLASGKTVTSPKPSAGVTIKTPKRVVLNRLNENWVDYKVIVNYGMHDYATDSQTEYDQLMTKVIRVIQRDYENIGFTSDRSMDQYFSEYINGARGIRDRNSPEFRTRRNVGLITAHNSIGTLVEAGLKEEQILGLVRAETIAWSLRNPESNFRTVHMYTAVFDALGYNTAILSRLFANHFAIVQLPNGQWAEIKPDGFEIVDFPSLLKSRYRESTEPTYGQSLRLSVLKD